jgi:hypothetical protein
VGYGYPTRLLWLLTWRGNPGEGLAAAFRPEAFLPVGNRLLLGLFTTFARVVELFEIEECNG